MILSKSQLVNNINSEISDQSYGQISPYDIRHNLLDIIDSVHNLTSSQELKSLNLATFPSGNTKVGQLTLENIDLDGYYSEDNTAIGYSALKSNYRGIKNTSVGSYSLSCNIYGEGNVALGYDSLAGNTVGHLNIGLGNYTLHNNKSGSNNVAIGHGAGYYINKNTSNKLFIAHHAVDGNYICNNPEGVGLIPLLYGDFSTLQLGVGVRNLHPHGKLQVGGDISPSGNNLFNIGHPNYNWGSIYLSKSIEFLNNTSITPDSTSYISISGSLIPALNNVYHIGLENKMWSSGHFENLNVYGKATINQLVSINTQIYANKVIYLGVNSSNQPLYNDINLNGGGITLKSTTNNKEYSLLYRPPSSGMPCFAGDSNSVWYSNISFQVPSTSYIKTNSIVSYNPASFGESDCYGLFFNSGITYVSRKNVLNINPGLPNGPIAGVGNINFLSNSGEASNYTLSLLSLESGVSVSQRFLTGTKNRTKDLTNNKDKLSGFELKYIDNSSNIQDPSIDRFVIGSYNNSSNFVNGLVMMKGSIDGSVLGITNISNITENILPKTILNVRSINNCIARFTTENNNYYKSCIQLLGSENCETSGVEIAYLNNSGIADVVIYKNSNATNFIRMKDTNEIGILSSGITNATITIGHSGINKLPVISLKDSLWVSDLSITPSGGYGKLYNLYDPRSYADQYSSLNFMDGSGNVFNLIVNKFDNLDGRAVYTDPSGNTFAGYLSPSGRKNITGAIKNNISYGYQGLYSIVSGSGNIAVGYDSLYNLTSGNNNIVIGKSSASGIRNTSNNIIIGNESFNKIYSLSNTSDNIVIGHNIGASHSGSYNYLVGNNGLVLLDGKLGPTNADKRLTLPSGGRIYINNANDTDSLCLKANSIEVIDSGGNDYPDNILTFKFIGNNSADLFLLSHVAPPITYPTSFSNSNRPYAQINGDLRLKGAIGFGDGTLLETSSGIPYARDLANSGVNLANSGIALANSGIAKINSAFIEGYMPNGLQAPVNSSSKTSGILILKNSNWTDAGNVFVVNRDTTSIIHSGAYVIAARVNDEYKPIWVSASDTACVCCNH